MPTSGIKTASVFAAGLVLAAALAGGALLWTWQHWCEPRLARLDEATEKQSESVSQLRTDWQDHREKDTRDFTRRFEQLDTSIGEVHQQLKPLRLIQAVPESNKKPRLPNTVAVLTPAEMAGDPSAEDAAHRLYASVLIGNLVEQPMLRVSPHSSLAACKVRSQGREKYAWSNAQEAGQVLGVQYVLTCSATEKRVGEFPFGQDEWYLHVELISVETGALALGQDWVLRQKAGFNSEKASWSGRVGEPLLEAARHFGKKVRLLALDPRLPAALRGDDRPAGAAEQIGFAELCYSKTFYAASVQFYADAFAADPSLVRNPNRYDAACSAARAGCGHGNDAAKTTEEDRARLRERAREWMQAELALRTSQAGTGAKGDRAEVAEKMEWWKQDRDLAGVRDADAVKKLPEEESHAWQQFWSDVEKLLQKCK